MNFKTEISLVDGALVACYMKLIVYHMSITVVLCLLLTCCSISWIFLGTCSK